MLDFGFYNMDCMEGMKQFPDKYFDLAIVDPPYGGVEIPTQKTLLMVLYVVDLVASLKSILVKISAVIWVVVMQKNTIMGIGIFHRINRTLMNYLEFLKTKSYGVVTTLNYRLQDVS